MRKVLGKICGWFSLFCASWLLAFNATAGVHFDLNVNVGAPGYFGPIPMVSGRSEEHTSELQSQR